MFCIVHRIKIYQLCPDHQVSAILLEPLVYQDDDETRRQVHQERRHADGQDVAHDLAAQAVNAAPEMEQFALVRKDVELPDERDNLRQHRGDGRAADTPPEAIDEQRVERLVDDHRIDGSVHRLARMPRSPQHGVQAQIHVRDDVPHEDDRHVVAGITDRRLARPEKVEDRIEQQQRCETECQADDEVQHHDVAQDVLRRLVVSLPEAHNFCNKIWNAFRLIKGWTNAEGSIPVPEDAHLAVQWFEQRLDAASVEMADLFSKYRLSEALMLVYKLFWDEFSSYLLEIVKPAYGQPINGFIYSMVINCFERLLELLHPFMPFITEELWQQLRQREPGASLMVTRLSETFEVNEKFLQEFEVAKEIISNIRSIRLQKNIAMKEQLRLQVIGNHPVEKLNSVIMKMCNLSSIMVVYNKAEGAASFMIGTTEFAVPLIDMLDIDAEINRLLAELKHKESFLQGIVKKLSNEKFVNNAPAAVIELERKKQADAESIIKSLKESLTILLKR